MKKLKEIARLLFECNLGIRPIARACNISASTASTYVEKFKELGATYKEICEIDEDSLSDLVSPKAERTSIKVLPDFVHIAGELKKKGVTLQLLHEEYKRDNPDGYEKSQFYQLYHDWKKKADPVMHIMSSAKLIPHFKRRSNSPLLLKRGSLLLFHLRTQFPPICISFIDHNVMPVMTQAVKGRMCQNRIRE